MNHKKEDVEKLCRGLELQAEGLTEAAAVFRRFMSILDAVEGGGRPDKDEAVAEVWRYVDSTAVEVGKSLAVGLPVLHSNN